MRRALFNLVCAVSLLLACASAGMWVRSRNHADELRWFIQLSDPTEDDWQGLLGVYRIYSVQSSQGAVGAWVRNREVWLSTPFPRAGMTRWTGSPKEPPNCAMNNAFAGGDAQCFPNDQGFALRWDRDQPASEWPYTAPWTARMIVLPWWVLVAAFAALPALSLVKAARAAYLRNHLDPTLCRACGYDLRATPQRCPECGTPVVGAATTTTTTTTSRTA